jgi:hypothetical protein
MDAEPTLARPAVLAVAVPVAGDLADPVVARVAVARAAADALDALAPQAEREALVVRRALAVVPTGDVLR